MAKRPLRVTGFTRFVLVMIIVAPMAYLAASYYNGEDGIANIKNLLGISKPAETEQGVEEETATDPGVAEDIKALKEENEQLKKELDYKSRRVDELQQETEALKKKLESLEKANGKTGQ